jgi:hypothetical protein
MVDEPYPGQFMPQSLNEPPGSKLGQQEPQVAPVITALTPDTCVIGSDDFTLYVIGEGFSDKSEIIFAGQPEPTTLSEDKAEVSTGVKPSLWGSAVVVQCAVRNGVQVSNELPFEFVAAAADESMTSRGKQSWQRQSQPVAKLSRQDMDEMTKSELCEHAAKLNVDVSASHITKAEIIDAIVKEQRKRG